MDIMSIFRSQPAPAATPAVTPTPVPTPAPTQALPATATPKPGEVAPTPGVMPTPNATPAPTPDKFADLWTPPANAPTAFDPSQMFSFDEAKMQSQLDKMNFASQIPAEKFQAIATGGEAAVAAMADIVNTLGRLTFKQNLMASGHLVQSGIGKSIPVVDARVQQAIKSTQVNSAIQAANPALSSPAAAPIVEALQAQLTAKYPMASPMEIQGLANEYLTNLAKSINAPADAAAAQLAASKAPKETDWSKYLPEHMAGG